MTTQSTVQRPAGADTTSPDERARATEAQMTDDERFSLIISLIGAVPSIGVPRDKRIPEGVNMSAGYTPGVPRLGVPALQSSDASMGVTNPGYRPDDKGATAFPASILVGSSFNPGLARDGGAAIGKEARLRGFNIQLAGGVNLARDVRNGRNFEYYSEDPWLTAVMGAEAVNGIQSQGVISTLKHYTLNNNETNRHWLDAIVDPAAHRESDLLAFQIAIERSEPGSIMSGYNKINGEYASGNKHLLDEVLKGAWGYYSGHGLSYTDFEYGDLKVNGGDTITATFTVTNTGKVAGADVAQVYLTDAAGERRMRLLGFERVELAPDASKTVTVKTDPRLLARFDGKTGIGQWRIAEGTYRIAVGKSAGDLALNAEAPLAARAFGK